MKQKMVKVMEIHAMLDEAALRTTLAKIEQMRTSPQTAGLDLHYGAVVSLEIAPEQVRTGTTQMQRCRIRAGGWTDQLSQEGLSIGELQT